MFISMYEDRVWWVELHICGGESVQKDRWATSGHQRGIQSQWLWTSFLFFPRQLRAPFEFLLIFTEISALIFIIYSVLFFWSQSDIETTAQSVVFIFPGCKPTRTSISFIVLHWQPTMMCRRNFRMRLTELCPVWWVDGTQRGRAEVKD